MNNSTFDNNTLTFNCDERLICAYFVGEELQLLHRNWLDVYEIMAAIICLSGIITNVINIVVFTRQNMIETSTVFVGLTIADLLYLTAAFLSNTISYVNNQHCTSQQTFSLICNWLKNNFHYISVILTVYVLVRRYVAVTYPIRYRVFSTTKRTVSIVCLCCAFITIWNIVFYTVYYETAEVNIKKTDKLISTYNSTRNCPLYRYYFRCGDEGINEVFLWIYGAVLQIIPSVSITIFSFLSTMGLYKASSIRSHLCNSVKSTRYRSWQRVSTMHVYMSGYYLITELVRAVILFLSYACYRYLEEMFDLLVILYKSTNILVYTTLLPCKDFKTTLKCIISQCCLIPASKVSNNLFHMQAKVPKCRSQI
ncbi:hypothetical protein CHUAL_011123 [Chamberlinius hualienensis]